LAVRVFKSLAGDEEPRRPGQYPYEHGDLGIVVYQSKWNIRFVIAFLPCYYINLSCVKQFAWEMVTS
jgi:hypothetical protein